MTGANGIQHYNAMHLQEQLLSQIRYGASKLTELSDLLVWMLRDRNSFKQRLNMWMRELIASVASVQE